MSLIIADKGDDVRGKEYGYVEDWGEQLVGKSQTVIVKLDLDTGKTVVYARESFDVEKDNPNVHKVQIHSSYPPFLFSQGNYNFWKTLER